MSRNFPLTALNDRLTVVKKQKPADDELLLWEQVCKNRRSKTIAQTSLPSFPG